MAAHRKCATGERENNHGRYPGDRALVAYRHVSNGSRRSWVYRGQERSLQRRCHSYLGGPTPYSPRSRPPPRYPSSSVMTITVSSECVCAVSPMHGTSSPRGHRPNLTTLANHLWRPPREYRPHCLRERQTERRPVSQCCRAAPKGARLQKGGPSSNRRLFHGIVSQRIATSPKNSVCARRGRRAKIFNWLKWKASES